MITSEKAFDMLPYVADIYDKLDLKDYIQKNAINTSDKSEDELKALQSEVGMKMIMHIVKNSSKVKDEVFNIVAVFSGISADEAKQQDFFKTLQVFKGIFSNKDLTDFFKQAMQ